MKPLPELAQLPDPLRAEIAPQYREWKRTTLRISLGIFAAAAAAAILLAAAGRPFFYALVPTALCAYIGLLLAGRSRKNALDRIVSGYPELSQYRGDIKHKLTGAKLASRIALCVLLLMISVIAGLLALEMLLPFRKDETDVPMNVLLRRCGRQYIDRVATSKGLLLILIAAAGMFGTMLWRDAAQFRLRDLNQTAQTLFRAVDTALGEMEDESLSWDAETLMIPPHYKAEAGSVIDRTQKYFPDSSNYYCAIVFNADTKWVMAVYISKHPLTQADLVPPDQEEQYRLLSSLLHANEAIGFYFSRT